MGEVTTSAEPQGLVLTIDRKPLKIEGASKIQDLTVAALSIEITDPANLTNATDIGTQISAWLKKLESERKAIVDPFNAGLKAINARFKALSEPASDALRKLGQKLQTYTAEQDALARQEELDQAVSLAHALRDDPEALQEYIQTEQRRSEGSRPEVLAAIREHLPKEVQASIPDLPDTPPAPPVAAPKRAAVYGNYGGAATQARTWVAEVEDITRLPMEYLQVDQVKLNAYMREYVKGDDNRQALHVGRQPIPGVRIHQTLSKVHFG
jgi:hypothetical protein